MSGKIMFHSVGYSKKNGGSLQKKTYNNLGNRGSLGCIQMCIRDRAKRLSCNRVTRKERSARAEWWGVHVGTGIFFLAFA